MELIEEYRNIKRFIGETYIRNCDYYYDCLNHCLDFIAKFHVGDTREEFEVHLNENKNLLKNIVNLFGINKWYYENEYNDTRSMVEFLINRNRKVFMVTINCIRMDDRDAHFILQLFNVYTFIITRCFFNKEEIGNYLSEHLIFFLKDILEPDKSDLDLTNCFIHVLSELDLKKTKATIAYFDYEVSLIFTSKLLTYVKNHIFESIEILIGVSMMKDVALKSKVFINKTVMNSIKLVEFFGQFYVHKDAGFIRTFVECILSTMDLLNLYSCSFDDVYPLKERFGFLVSHFLLEDGAMIFQIMINYYNVRCDSLLRSLFHSQIVEDLYKRYERLRVNQTSFAIRLDRRYSKYNIYSNKVHIYNCKNLQTV